MANRKHVGLLRRGVATWNRWRKEHSQAQPNLSGAHLLVASLPKANLSEANLEKADLRAANLSGANLSGANLSGADLSFASLHEATLSGANLSEAKLSGAQLFNARLENANLVMADLYRAKLEHANLTGATLSGANLSGATFRSATLSGADLEAAVLVGANLENANLDGCRVYGISAWNVKVNKKTKQSDLIITQRNEATVTVSDLEVAQFIYLLLNRVKLRSVINTITSKAVLLLGRFTPDRKAVLDALADELRQHNLLPIIFDFERSTNRDFTETIKILAGLSLFVIVDITKPKSAPQELTAIVPDYRIPFVPILKEGENPYSMFIDFTKYDWVLKPILTYRTKEVLLDNFRNAILKRAWKKHQELQRKKNEKLEAVSIEDMIGRKRPRTSRKARGDKKARAS